LRRSFTPGDTSYIAQFWFARYIYLDGDQDEARRIFNGLANANIETETKREPRGIVMEAGQPKRFSGTIKNLQIYVAFIVRDGLQDTIFAFNKYSNEMNGANSNKIKESLLN
jgi:hypothetical protein